MTPEARTDYIVRCLIEAASMYEDDAKAFLAEHDADVLRQAAEACPVHSPTGSPCDCGHGPTADCHPNARRTP